MKNFHEWLVKRMKTEHEPYIRKVASEVRNAHFAEPTEDNRINNRRYLGFHGKKTICQSGDCGVLSDKVAHALRSRYPSAKVVDGAYTNSSDHTWVEIPEIDHYVDPSHDQNVKFHKSRKTMMTRNGLFPNAAIRIGKRNRAFRRDYSRY